MQNLPTIRLKPDNPIVLANPKPFYGRRIVIKRKAFYQAVFTEMLAYDDVVALGVTKHILNTSFKYYQLKFPEWNWQGRKRRVYGRPKFGNKHGGKERPDVLLTLETLEKHKGKAAFAIAQAENVSLWFVVRSLEIHGVTAQRGIRGWTDADLEIVQMLDQFAPGLVDASLRYYEAPEEFWLLARQAYQQLMDFVWVMRKIKPAYDYALERLGLPDSARMCWSLNKHEQLVSSLLIHAEIPHVCQVKLGKFLFDFKVGAATLVEVDGSSHTLEIAKARDKQKEKLAKQSGFKLLRISTALIDSNPTEVLRLLRESSIKG